MPDAADDIVNVEGYNLIRKDRGSRAGGVALYIRSHIQFTLLDIPLEYASPVEFLVVKVRLKKTICAFGVFYRPPKRSHLSLSVLGDVIDYLRLCNIETFVFMGDLNVDLLTDSNESPHFKQLLSFNDCQQLVESPTRITDLSESLLDVFIVNSDLMMANAEVLDMCISDHNVIKCRLQLHIESMHRSPKTFRSFKKFEYDSFSRDAEAIDWNRIYNLPNLDLLQ